MKMFSSKKTRAQKRQELSSFAISAVATLVLYWLL
jgi:hypothetical protein